LPNLAALMQRRFNPALTQAAQTLYHSAGDDLGPVANAMAGLLGCMDLTSTMKPTLHGAEVEEYATAVHLLERDALALQTAALEQDAEGARHWFMHVKSGCAACHARFRPDEGDTEGSHP
jgi:hypothetical protein